MPVSVDDVRHIAALARLALSDERARAMTAELNGILAHMDVLSKVDTADVEPVVGIGAAGTPLRSDDVKPAPLAASPETFAPRMKDGFFLVPRLSTHED